MTKTKEPTYNLKPKTMWEKGWEDGYMGRDSRDPQNPQYADGYWVGVQQSMLDE